MKFAIIQVKAVDDRLYDVIFVGTDQGNIFKVVNLAGTKANTKQPSHHIYTFRVTDVSSVLHIVNFRGMRRRLIMRIRAFMSIDILVYAGFGFMPPRSLGLLMWGCRHH